MVIKKFNDFIKNEITGWKTWEILWLVISFITILTLSIFWGDSTLGIISALSGVVCVICTGKGKLSAYIFGGINTALYAYIAFTANYYGEVMLNAFYYFPLQFYGFYIWSKNINKETKEVKKRSMSKKNLALLFMIVTIATILYGVLLKYMGGNLPFVDSFSTVVSVIAMIVSIKMFAEQWLLWIAVDVVTVFMWGYAFFVQGSESIATLLMWMMYLLNAIFMYIKWLKEARLRGVANEV